MALLEKTCNVCQKLKPIVEFQKEKAAKSGYRNRCKSCVNKKAAEWRKGFENKYKLSYTQYNRGKGLDTYYRRVYGITEKEYNSFLIVQNNVCAVCGKKNMGDRRLSVDHDHRTGKIRGLLCVKCNSVLGMVDDDILLLTNMIGYLRK
jgi:hypothetical protein